METEAVRHGQEVHSAGVHATVVATFRVCRVHHRVRPAAFEAVLLQQRAEGENRRRSREVPGRLLLSRRPRRPFDRSDKDRSRSRQLLRGNSLAIH